MDILNVILEYVIIALLGAFSTRTIKKYKFYSQGGLIFQYRINKANLVSCILSLVYLAQSTPIKELIGWIAHEEVI